jgi:eukaryotic-like serine/threonine-protein kinase
MALQPGTQLGAYRILSSLGAGGMGEVYRATDIRLNRDVAIKVLPASFANDPDRLRRFEQEARATSALNHPNILSVFDIGTHDGAPYIVAELLEGEELRAQLNDGPLAPRKAIDYAQQIAAGLAAAHGKGITHRDLKPENLFITIDGRVKILDFGLAKLRPQTSAVSSGSDVQTQRVLTDPGVVMGTVGYMSPEQIRGQVTDHRADIFSFGVIFYEMLSGTRTFTGDSAVEVMNAILKDEPPELSETNARINPALDKIVSRCLEKKPERRFQSTSDLCFAIEALSTPSGSGERIEAVSAAADSHHILRGRRFLNRERLAWVVAAIALLAALALGLAYFRRAPVEMRAVRAFIPPPEKTSFHFVGVPIVGPVAISPDGQRLVFAAKGESGTHELWVREIDSLAAQPLPGTVGGYHPFWSPDSRSIGFFASGKLKRIALTGGPAVSLADAADARGGTWNRDDVIVFCPNAYGPLHRVSVTGGAPTPLTELDKSKGESTHRWPFFLPDGTHFLFTTRIGGGGLGGENTGSGNVSVSLGSLDGAPPRVLLPARSNAAYASGYLLFLRETTLMAQRFDERSLALSGEAFPLAEGVQYDQAFSRGTFSVSDNGVLVYQGGQSELGSMLLWYDRSGKQIGSVGQKDLYLEISLSPDRKQLAAYMRDARLSPADIWIYDVSRGLRTRFTFDPFSDETPVWSPDGNKIAFASSRKRNFNLYMKTVTGAGAEELLLETEEQKFPSSWSPDGRYLAYYVTANPTTGKDVWILPLFGDRKPFPFAQTSFNEGDAEFSPDGHWIAYSSDESGREEVYVTSFPNPGRKWQVSSAGGMNPRWRRDGNEIYYLNQENAMAATEVSSKGDNFEVGAYQRLFQTRAVRPGKSYDISPDGQRFLINSAVDTSSSSPLVLVVNWTDGLKKN